MNNPIRAVGLGQARKSTMSDVALLAGVSPMSVSNTFKRPDKVSAEIQAKVFEAANKLGYVPNVLAGTLASGRSRIVGVVVPSVRNSNFAGVIQGLEEALGQLGYDLMLSVADNQEREFRAVQAFLGRRVDGIVLTGIDHGVGTTQLLRRGDTPVVETWNLNGPFIDMAVGFSLHDAAFEMAQLMVQRGYRRIGFASYVSPGNTRLTERYRGFQSAMLQAGLRDDLQYYAHETLGFGAGRVALEGLLEQEPALDAVFCATDVLAVGIIFECNRRGWSIPDRLAVAGYGDYDIAAEITPGLTTVRTPGHEIGAAAARMIAEAVDVNSSLRKQVDVGYEIIVRNSI